MIAFIWSKPMITNYKEQFVQKKRTFFAYGKSMSVQKSTGTYIHSIHYVDIWWSILDKINDFKAIFRIVIFFFGEINKSLFCIFFISI